MMVAGVVLLAFTFTLALYSIPSDVPRIPLYPFISLPFPLLSGLVVISAILLVAGWIYHPKGSFGQILIGAVSFVAAGAIIRAISFVTAVPVDLEGVTIHVELYAAHATMVLSLGILLALFGLLFWAAERREGRGERIMM